MQSLNLIFQYHLLSILKFVSANITQKVKHKKVKCDP